MINDQYVKGDSLFNRINKVDKQYKYLTDDIKTEVIIIGGGVTGAILSYYFSKKNIDTVILEKGRVAHGSTGITTALLQYELDSNFNEVKKYLKDENIIRAYKLGLKALDEIDNIIKENGNECDYEKKDTLLYTGKKLEYDEIKDEYEIRANNGLDVRFIDENNNPFSFDLKAGVYCVNGGAQFDPYKFTIELLSISEKSRCRIFENTEVLKLEYGESGVKAITKYGNLVEGKIAIVATGYNTKLFTNRNFGIKSTTFNIATKPVDTFNGWFNRVLIRDNKDPYNYYRTTKDNRIIVGGEDINFIPDINFQENAEEKYEILEQKLKNMFPDIDGIEVEYKYCGAFASTNDNLGFIGKDPDNDKLWYCLGYGANGILFAVLGGLMLSDLYLGEYNEDLELFKVDRFD